MECVLAYLSLMVKKCHCFSLLHHFLHHFFKMRIYFARRNFSRIFATLNALEWKADARMKLFRHMG